MAVVIAVIPAAKTPAAAATASSMIQPTITTAERTKPTASSKRNAPIFVIILPPPLAQVRGARLETTYGRRLKPCLVNNLVPHLSEHID